jgi:hypothetical protein
MKKAYARVWEAFINDKKGFVIRYTFINLLRVYYSTILSTAWMMPVFGSLVYVCESVCECSVLTLSG